MKYPNTSELPEIEETITKEVSVDRGGSRHKRHHYPETEFGGFTDVDGTIAFYTRVNALLRESFRVIDFGCGRGEHQEDPVRFRRELRSLRGKVSYVIGIDPDISAAEKNPTVDEARPLGKDELWPVDSQSADLIVCDWVVEHLARPSLFFSEAFRVLGRGGILCIRTLNALSYVGLASRITPNKLHTSVLSKIQPDRKEEDVFPTVYRCNTVFALRRELTKHGFSNVVYGYDAEPSYLSFSGLAYRVGVLHQKLAPAFLGPSLFAFGRALRNDGSSKKAPAEGNLRQ